MARENDKKARGDGSLGERVRRRRKMLGLTAKDLAQATNVSPSYISQLEHSKQDQPSLEVLGAMAATLGVSTSELLGEPLAFVVAPETPPTLKALADELDLDAATTAMLAGVHIDGHRPMTREGWLLVLLAIRHACAPGQTLLTAANS